MIAEEEMLKEILKENPKFKSYLEVIHAKMYYCDRTNEVRVSGSDSSGDDDFDLSLELFIAISNQNSSFGQLKIRPILRRVK